MSVQECFPAVPIGFETEDTFGLLAFREPPDAVSILESHAPSDIHSGFRFLKKLPRRLTNRNS